MSKCQIWLQVMECLLILLCFFCELCTKLMNIHVWSVLSSPKIHILWECKYFVIIKFQVWLQVMEGSLILLRFLGIFIHYWLPFRSKVLYLHQNFTDCISNQKFKIQILICWQPDITSIYGSFSGLIRFF